MDGLDTTFKEFLKEWEQKNLTVKGGCGLKGRIFFNVTDIRAYFMPVMIIQELGKVMILERKGSIWGVI